MSVLCGRRLGCVRAVRLRRASPASWRLVVLSGGVEPTVAGRRNDVRGDAGQARVVLRGRSWPSRSWERWSPAAASNTIGWVLASVCRAAGRSSPQYADYWLWLAPARAPRRGSPPGSELGWCRRCSRSSDSLFPLLSRRAPALRRWRDPSAAARRSRSCRHGLAPGHFVDAEPFERSEPAGDGSAAGAFEALAGLGSALVQPGARSRRHRRWFADAAERAAIERLQLKWMAFAASLFAVGVRRVLDRLLRGASSERSCSRGRCCSACFCTIPVAAGVAILRYRLYDIDVVINRTLVYGALTAARRSPIWAACCCYSWCSSASPTPIWRSPARRSPSRRCSGRRAHASRRRVDRRFFRRKYDAQRTLEAFAARLRDEVSLDALSGELRAVVAETMQPAHVSLWLRRRR